MNREILEEIKKDYETMNRISSGDFSEIDELEKSLIVQRYKYLLDMKKSLDGPEVYRQANIFGEIINKYSNGLIAQTNNIWFWFLDMPVRKYEEMFETSLDNGDKDSIISVYMDLENSKGVITIPIEKQVDFESTNTVIRGKRTIFDPVDRYYNTRYEFFNLCINKGQSQALEIMLQEELSRAKKVQEEKEYELEQLRSLLNFGVISEEEYGENKHRVSSKR